MSKDEPFVEANLEAEPSKVILQEAKLLFKKSSQKFKLDYIYHWNRLLVAAERIQKDE